MPRCELSIKITSAKGSAIEQTEFPRGHADERATDIYQGGRAWKARQDIFIRCHFCLFPAGLPQQPAGGRAAGWSQAVPAIDCDCRIHARSSSSLQLSMSCSLGTTASVLGRGLRFHFGLTLAGVSPVIASTRSL